MLEKNLEEGKDALFIEHRGKSSTMKNTISKRNPKINNQTEEDLLVEVQQLRMENEY